MILAFMFGLIAGLALFIGALVGIYLKPSKKTSAKIMAFGSGVLISAITFDLIEDAYQNGGILPISAGIILGTLAFVLGDWLIGKRGGHHRKHLKSERSDFKGEANSLAITFGALLDGIPESVIIGTSLLAGKGAGILMFVAVFLSNIPEGISGVYGITKAKKNKIFILALWLFIAIICGFSSYFGYRYLAGASDMLMALGSSVAAGSILAMITDTMIPEAYEEGGVFVALSTVFGFLVSFIVSKLT